MAESPDNLVLVYLRRLDEKVDLVIDRLHEPTNRVGMLETQYASLSNRLDRIDVRLDRIERRLELTPIP
jgi:L-rhamnose isomerase